MQATAEISFYPLGNSDFKPIIRQFVYALRDIEGLEVVTNGMSTLVTGDWELLMQTLTQHIPNAWQEDGQAVYSLKFTKGNRLKSGSLS